MKYSSTGRCNAVFVIAFLIGALSAHAEDPPAKPGTQATRDTKEKANKTASEPKEEASAPKVDDDNVKASSSKPPAGPAADPPASTEEFAAVQRALEQQLSSEDIDGSASEKALNDYMDVYARLPVAEQIHHAATLIAFQRAVGAVQRWRAKRIVSDAPMPPAVALVVAQALADENARAHALNALRIAPDDPYARGTTEAKLFALALAHGDADDFATSVATWQGTAFPKVQMHAPGISTSAALTLNLLLCSIALLLGWWYTKHREALLRQIASSRHRKSQRNENTTQQSTREAHPQLPEDERRKIEEWKDAWNGLKEELRKARSEYDNWAKCEVETRNSDKRLRGAIAETLARLKADAASAESDLKDLTNLRTMLRAQTEVMLADAQVARDKREAEAQARLEAEKEAMKERIQGQIVTLQIRLAKARDTFDNAQWQALESLMPRYDSLEALSTFATQLRDRWKVNETLIPNLDSETFRRNPIHTFAELVRAVHEAKGQHALAEAFLKGTGPEHTEQSLAQVLDRLSTAMARAKALDRNVVTHWHELLRAQAHAWRPLLKECCNVEANNQLYDLLRNALLPLGIEPVDTRRGTMFDPGRHESVSTEAYGHDAYPLDSIVQTLQASFIREGCPGFDEKAKVVTRSSR